MAKPKASQSLGITICDEPREVVELCMQCPYDDCKAPSSGCSEVRKLRQALKEGKEYRPPENWGANPEPEPPEPVNDPQALLDQAWAKMEKPKQPAIMIEEIPQPNVQHGRLHHFNEAIKALELLHEDVATLGPDLTQMIQTLKRERAVRYEYLIDWAAVARGGKK